MGKAKSDKVFPSDWNERLLRRKGRKFDPLAGCFVGQRRTGMDVLYCGDRNIESGLIISVLSLLKNVTEPLHIYVMTMELVLGEREILAVSEHTVQYLDRYVKRQGEENSVRRIDATELFVADQPSANLKTRFTPCCMLRLYADLIPELPDRLLYLDNDVVCRKACDDFYHQDMEGYEIAGVRDHYGKWFFRRNPLHMDYMNSGVLLLNLDCIRKTGLFAGCRTLCREKKMFMPDQSAINKLAGDKKLWKRAYNEQRKLHPDTVFQHFTTSFRFFPWIHTLTVKPWQLEEMHDKLDLYEYDDLYREYTEVKRDCEAVASGIV